MILKILNIKTSFKKFNPILISWCLLFAAVFIYPHKAIAGGAFNDAKTIISILILSAFAIFVPSCLKINKPVFLKTPLAWPLITLTFIVIISAIFAQNRPIAFEAVMLFTAYLFCFYMALDLFNSPGNQTKLAYLLILLSLGLCLYGLMMFYFFNNNPRLTTVWRLRATFGNSNQMAGFLAMMIPFCTGMILNKKYKKALVIFLGLTNLIMIVAMFFTFARGGWISTFTASCFVLVCYALVNTKNVKTILGTTGLVFLILFTLFLSSTDLVKRFNTLTQQGYQDTAYGRLLAWEGTMDMIKANPLTGVGPGNYRTAFTQFQPPGLTEPYKFAHNDYLHFISETGILLIPIIIWMVFQLFHTGLSKMKSASNQNHGIVIGAMGSIFAILIYSFTDFNLHIPANAMLFIVLSALIAVPLKNYH